MLGNEPVQFWPSLKTKKTLFTLGNDFDIFKNSLYILLFFSSYLMHKGKEIFANLEGDNFARSSLGQTFETSFAGKCHLDTAAA